MTKEKAAHNIEGIGDIILFVILLVYTNAFNYQNLGYCLYPIIDYIFYAAIIIAYFYMVYVMQSVKGRRKRITKMLLWYFVVGGIISLRFPFVEFPADVVYLLKLWAYLGIIFVIWLLTYITAYFIQK